MQSLDKEEFVQIILTCALHGQDTALDAPWASEEGAAAAMSILISMAQDVQGATREGVRSAKAHTAT